ncbi:MAG: hypothetical protein PHD97_08605 [Bacteroidales bacterium]|nr:hypothetical protein [Bacteroidales bacterium]
MAYFRNKYYNTDIQVEAMKSRCPKLKIKKRGRYDIEFITDLFVKPELPIYTVSITYRGNQTPLVKVIKPELVENAPHIYKESKTLCLYHPDNYHWTKEKLIAKDIVSWTATWIYFYEVWLQKGKWYGPEVHHIIPKIQQ